jgi:hypothetical protein
MFGCLSDTILIAGAKGCCLNRLTHPMKSEERGMFGASLLVLPATPRQRTLRLSLVLFSNEESACKWRRTNADFALQPR